MDDTRVDVPARPRSAAWWVAAAGAVVMVAVQLWSARLAVRPGGSGDFATVFAATRVWAAGGNPYAQGQVERAYDAAGGTWGVRPTAAYTPSVYPPGTFALVAPLAAHPSWPLARGIWATVNAGLMLAMVAVLPGLAGIAWADVRAPVVVIAALALGPARVAVTMGQPVVSTTALIVLAAWVVDRDRRGEWVAGVLLAVAVCLKPQIAGPFVGYFLLRRRWLAGGIAVGGLAAATGVGVARLTAAGVPWLADLRANLAAAAGPGQINDVTFHSTSRFSMVNLQTLLCTVLDDPRLVTAINAAALLAAAVAFAVVVRRRRRRSATADDLPARSTAELAFVAAWTLLPVYHRWYDGEMLALALAWAAAAAPVRRWTAAAVAAAGLTVPFLASLALHLGQYRVTHRNPPMWEVVILPNQAWAVCGLAGLMLYVLWRPAAGPGPAGRSTETPT